MIKLCKSTNHRHLFVYLNTSRVCRWMVIILSFGLSNRLLILPASANSLNGRVTLQQAMSGGPEIETQKNLTQRYSTNFTSSVSDAINVNGDLSYNKNWSKGAGFNESVQQNGAIGVDNDIFMARTHGAMSIQMPNSAPNSNNYQWGVSLASRWHKDYWPSLRINYNHNKNTNESIPRTTDNDRQQIGFATDLNLVVAQVNYRYSTSKATDNIYKLSSKQSGQSLGVSGNRTFMDNRLTISIAQQFTEYINGTIRKYQPAGMVDTQLYLSGVSSSIDDTPEFDPLSSTPALADDDFQNVAININNGESTNIGFSTDTTNGNRIYIYLDPSVILNDIDASSLRFNLYSSPDVDGISWTQRATSLTPVYDGQSSCYYIDYDFTLMNTLYKLVATSWPLATIPVTELQMVYRQAGSDIALNIEDKRTSSSTSLNAGFLLRENLPLAYNVSLSSNKNPFGLKSTRLSQSGSARWRLSRYFSPSISINTNSNIQDGQTKDLNNAVGLNITSSPINSISINVGTTQNANFSDSQKTSENHNYSVGINAQLYPDLTSSLSSSVSEQHSPITGATSITHNYQISMTARINSKLTAFLSSSQNNSATDLPGQPITTDKSSISNLSMNMRPSDILSIRMNATKNWDITDQPVTYELGTSLALLQTSKMQISANYSLNKTAISQSSNYTASCNWSLSRYFTLQTSGSIVESDTRHWSFQTQLSSSF